MRQLLEDSPLKSLNLRPTNEVEPTYPAWQPSQVLDHILVTPELEVTDCQVLSDRISDHLPVAVELAAVRRPALQ